MISSSVSERRIVGAAKARGSSAGMQQLYNNNVIVSPWENIKLDNPGEIQKCHWQTIKASKQTDPAPTR